MQETPIITVFSKAECNSCDQTKGRLEAWNLPYQERRVDQDSAAMAEVLSLGYREMPVVQVTMPGGETQHWSGFRYDKLKALSTTRETLAA